MEIENRETFEITMMTLVNCMSEILQLLQDEEILDFDLFDHLYFRNDRLRK